MLVANLSNPPFKAVPASLTPFLIKSKSNVNTPLITFPAAAETSISVLNAFM